MNEQESARGRLFDYIQTGNTAQVRKILHDYPEAIHWAAPNADGLRKALHIAAIYGEAEIARALVSAGADIEAKDSFNETPLSWALLREGRAPAALALLELGADPHARARDGRNPLHYAALGGSYAAVEKLLELGADINAQTDSGATALHLAATAEDMQMVGLLVRLGIDPAIKNAEGQVAGHLNSSVKAAIAGCCDNKREDQGLIQTAMQGGSATPVAVRRPLTLKKSG